MTLVAYCRPESPRLRHPALWGKAGGEYYCVENHDLRTTCSAAPDQGVSFTEGHAIDIKIIAAHAIRHWQQHQHCYNAGAGFANTAGVAEATLMVVFGWRLSRRTSAPADIADCHRQNLSRIDIRAFVPIERISASTIRLAASPSTTMETTDEYR